MNKPVPGMAGVYRMLSRTAPPKPEPKIGKNEAKRLAAATQPKASSVPNPPLEAQREAAAEAAKLEYERLNVVATRRARLDQAIEFGLQAVRRAGNAALRNSAQHDRAAAAVGV